MEAYLERCEESFQNGLVKCRYQTSLTRSSYFWTKRTTSSDVMSVITTVRAFDTAGNHTLSPLGDANPTPFNMPKYSSPFEPSKRVQLRDEEHDRINAALWREQQQFMARLQARRGQRASLETGAAHRIQAMFRGHASRQWWAGQGVGKLQTRQRVRSQLRGALDHTGWVLTAAEFKADVESRRQQSARTIQCGVRSGRARTAVQARRGTVQRQQQERGARIIQNGVRRSAARAALRRESAWARDTKRLVAAEYIQRAARRNLARHKVHLRRLVLHRLAATLIQSAFRRRAARRRVRRVRESLEAPASRA